VDVETALDGAGLRAMIASIHCPDGSRRPKPEPDLYLAACRELGADPAQSIAIEDAVPGVLAARSAGLLALGLAPADGSRLDAGQALTALWPLDLQKLESMLARMDGRAPR
jgi:beta-phosphoglucomutase-like phosphatase (HAD superfamily)